MFSASKTAAPVSGGYSVKQSLRFRSSASAYLSRTPSVAGNRQTWTWSAWVKRGATGVRQSLLDGYAASAGHVIEFTTSNTLEIYAWGGPSAFDLITTQVFRDPSAWYHIVVAIDTTQATSTNRIKLYVNGIQTTSFSTATYPPQNDQLYINNNVLQDIGRRGDGQFYFDGYLAEVNFIDGQALTPSSFGATNATTGVWQPARYTGSYGTNGFYLTFGNKTSTTTLGNDTSGNGNNWTPNNISLTAGSTYDSMLDSPTNYDDGGNGVGNYCVLNPIAGSSTTFSNGNLNASGQSSVGTFWVATGKWYWEAAVTSGITGNTLGDSWASFGVTDGIASDGFCYISDGEKENGGRSAFGATWTNGDIIGVALDAGAKSLTFYKNGTSQGSFTFSSTSTIGYTPCMFPRAASGTRVYYFNFGQRPFSYTPPSGFKALNTQNLPTPAIVNGAGYMAATTWTGNSSSQSIVNTVNGVGFQPDFVWLKNRTNAYSHVLQDVARGVGKTLQSNTTNAEQSNGVLTSFDASGFSLNNGTGDNVGNLVGWQWKANGTAVSNTSGTITSQVSANTTAGFSVVTYTGTGANATVGHGLGVAPSFIIVKSRTVVQQWLIYHISTGNTQATYFTTATPDTNSVYWNNISPTSSVFSLGASLAGNTNASTNVAYCFAAIAGYSAFGSYTGNGSADGPFVYLGFRPRWILVKRTDATDNWWLEDTSRNAYNVTGLDLSPNTSSAELNNTPVLDIVSNGFKLRNSYTGYNASGGTYIYACFAENPFKNSLAR